jgi:hypothetical protein
VLQQLGPLHYKTLAGVMIEGKYWVPRGRTEPGAMVYFQLHKDIRTRGDQSPFVLLGKGVFALAGQEIAVDPATMAPPRANRNPDKVARRRKAPPESLANQTCGGCAHIEFGGAGQVTLACGECALFSSSGRVGVQATETACPLWRRRSEARVASDRATAERYGKMVAAVAKCAQRGVVWTTKFSKEG